MKIKLFKILSTFSKNELNRLEKFIRSPYFNSHTDTLILFEELRKFHPDFKSDNVQPEKLCKKIYPGEPIQPEKIRILFTYLTRLCWHYFAFTQLEKDVAETDYWTLLELEERGLDPLIPYLIKKSEEKLDSQKALGSDFFLNRYRLEKQKFFLTQKGIKNRKASQDINNLQIPIDQYFLAEKLRFACVVFHKHAVYGDVRNKVSWQNFLNYFHSFDFSEVSILGQAFFYALTLYHPDYSPNYNELKTLILESEELIPADLMIDLIGYCLNFCGLQYRKGNYSYLEELFIWYQFIESGKLLSVYPSFMVHNYKNAVAVSLRLKKFDWVENFVERYKDELPEEYKEEAYKYNLALVAYYQKEFSRAKRFLLLGEYLDIFYKINRDVLLFKINFEEGFEENYDLNLALSQAAINFIGRQKKLTKKNKVGYQGFFRKGKKIMNLYYRNDPNNLGKLVFLEDQIRDQEDLTTDKLWLLKQITDLKTQWESQ